MTRVQVAIVGAGQIASLHAKGYEEDERAEIRAVCDEREDVAIEHALKWKAQDYYLSYKDLLRDPAIHAVSILTPNYMHASCVMEALRAGKHVHVARPIALTLAEADQIIGEARRRNLVAEVAEPLFFHAPLREARGYLEGGEVGDPVGVRIKICVGAPEGGWSIRPESWLWRFDPQKSGGGPFLFDSTYGALVAASFMLGRLELIQAWIGRTEIYPGYYVDAPATMMWRHGRGCMGSLELTYSPEMYIKSETYPTETSLELTGTRGMLWVRLSPGQMSSRAPLEMYRDGRVFSFNELDGSWEKGFERSIRNFVSAILGESQPACSAELARRHLEMALAARDSSLAQRVQRIGGSQQS
ncbi:MAG: hypothetical protein CMH57_08300 [Myxococcales bacterium]|nr:hypothetical protein [Myxococcales bacterium]